MITNLRPDTIYAVHLRADSVSGGKDWVGSITTQGELHTYWGRTGQVVQHAAKPGDFDVLRKLIDNKKNGKDRYQQVDEYHQQQGWQSQSQAPVQPRRKPPQPAPASTVDLGEAPTAAIEWDF